MLRGIAGVIGGFIAWWLIATACDLAMRAAWPEYAAVEKAMTFTLAMMVARLILGAVASACAGFVAAWLSRGNRRAVTVLAVLLLVFFVPVHYRLGERFPAWYHLTFLLSLLLITLLGAMLYRSSAKRQRVGAPTTAGGGRDAGD